MENYFGIIEDPRSYEEKSQDYPHSSLASGVVLTWIKKEISELKKYTKRNQDGSLSCCGQGSAKGVETLIHKIMSAHPPYRSRSNFPGGGMWTQNIGEVWYKVGSNLEELDQSQNLGEQQLNRDITIPTPYKIGGYLFPNCKKIDEIAQAIESFGHCMLIFHANGLEWNEKPEYNSSLPINFGHCITGVDFFLDENNEKCIYIEDSASLDTSMLPLRDGHRVITETYLKARCTSAIYFTSVKPLEMPYIFSKILRRGSVGFDVKKLQLFLNNQGYALTVDGKFGKFTGLAVENFQRKHGLKDDQIVGPKTNAVINSLQ